MEYIFLFVASLIIAFVLIGLFFQPRFILKKLTQKHPEVIYYVETNEKIIALTIDDGPCNSTSRQILDLLDKYKVKATFFLISDNLPGNEDIVRRMVSEGHEIGNHNTKEEPSYKLPLSEFEKQLEESHKALSEFGPIKYYRPGSGWYNQAMIDRIKQYNYLGVLASVHPYDPQIPSIAFAKLHLMINTSPGSILLLHDCADRGERTLEVLEYVIPRLLSKGYQFITVSELLSQADSLD